MCNPRNQAEQINAVVASLMSGVLVVKKAAEAKDYGSPEQQALIDLANLVRDEVQKLWSVSGALRTEANRMEE